MNANPHFNCGISFFLIKGVDVPHFVLHTDRCRNSIRLWAFGSKRRTEYSQNGISDKLNDRSPITLDHLCHFTQKMIDHFNNNFRRKSVRKRSKSTQIRHHNSQIPLLSTDRSSLRVL